jgi:hypothetical protein
MSGINITREGYKEVAKKGFGWYVGGGTRLERCILQAVIVFSRIDAVIHFLKKWGA